MPTKTLFFGIENEFKFEEIVHFRCRRVIHFRCDPVTLLIICPLPVPIPTIARRYYLSSGCLLHPLRCINRPFPHPNLTLLFHHHKRARFSVQTMSHFILFYFAKTCLRPKNDSCFIPIVDSRLFRINGVQGTTRTAQCVLANCVIYSNNSLSPLLRLLLFCS